jgi:hypothetical protein
MLVVCFFKHLIMLKDLEPERLTGDGQKKHPEGSSDNYYPGSYPFFAIITHTTPLKQRIVKKQ